MFDTPLIKMNWYKTPNYMYIDFLHITQRWYLGFRILLVVYLDYITSNRGLWLRHGAVIGHRCSLNAWYSPKRKAIPKPVYD